MNIPLGTRYQYSIETTEGYISLVPVQRNYKGILYVLVRGK